MGPVEITSNKSVVAFNHTDIVPHEAMERIGAGKDHSTGIVGRRGLRNVDKDQGVVDRERIPEA